MCLLAKIKSFLCRFVILIEFCHRCGIRQPLVWWCDSNELWEEVTGKKNSIYCPKCFDILAEQKGITLQWHVQEEYRFEKNRRVNARFYRDLNR